MMALRSALVAVSVYFLVLSPSERCDAFGTPKVIRRALASPSLPTTTKLMAFISTDEKSNACVSGLDDIPAKESFHRFVQSTIFATSIAFSTFSIHPAFAAITTTTTTTTSSSSITLAADDTPMAPPAYDETWNLVKKYALDQKYNGQDWDEAYTKYAKGLDPTTTDEDRIMKAATNLVSLLGDKYSRILDKDAYTRIQKFDLIGVGATLMPDPVTKEIVLGAPPVQGSAAAQAGLKAGDTVLAVNGAETAGRTAFDIIDQISEDPNAGQITFTIRSVGDDKTRDVLMKREFQEVKDPISYRVSETRDDGTKVGYARIAEFNSVVKPNLEAALKDLESQNVDAYVIDVRGNPGGAFQSVSPKNLLLAVFPFSAALTLTCSFVIRLSRLLVSL